MAQEYKQKQHTKQAEHDETDEAKDLRNDSLGDVDALLDEIDEVLEENAQEFVESYIQQGGQ